MLRFQRLACDKMIDSSRIQSLVTAYDGDAIEFFGSMGGHRNFLEQYALILEQESLTILDELGDFAGQRFPSDFDISCSEKHFSWFFHFHDEDKSGKGHFHLYASPEYFNDSSTSEKTHIIAIELTENGDLSGFFVPNNWVTRDHPRRSEEIVSTVNVFHTNNNKYSISLNLWLTAILMEFEDIITNLLMQKQQFLGTLNRADRDKYFQNREVEKICEQVI